MMLGRIVLGTARGPVASLASSYICLVASGLVPAFAGTAFALCLIGGLLVISGMAAMAPPSPKWLRRLHRGADYRLPMLLVGAVAAWIGRGLVPSGECPSRALTILGGIVPMILGGVAGVQCAAAVGMDLLRLARADRRRPLFRAIWVRKRLAFTHSRETGEAAR